MNNPPSIVFRLVLILVAASQLGCQRFGGKFFRDTVAVREESAPVPLPQKAPKTVYVSDFSLELQDFHGDQGIGGVLPGGLPRTPSPLSESRLPHPLSTTDPAGKSSEIVQTMAAALVSGLREKGIPAERLPPGELPRDGWMILGRFTDVDEGNRIKRSALGFSQGASQMEVNVGITDLSGPNPTLPFAVFGTFKEPGKKPGAAMTMNPYAAAARFVMERNASEKDTRKTADQIVAELLKYRDQVQGRVETSAGP
jgi:hypothetical protein